MKKITTLLLCFFSIIGCSKVYTTKQSEDRELHRLRLQAEKLYLTSKIISGVNAAILVIMASDPTFKLDDSEMKLHHYVLAGGWLCSAVANFVVHCALIWRAKHCHKFNKVSVGVGLLLNPTIVLEVVTDFLGDSETASTILNIVPPLIGATKALYDGYEYYTSRSEDNLEDSNTASDHRRRFS